MQLTIVSGRSGSGKSICLNVLEDMGYYCICNLPLALLTALPEQLTQQYKQVAISLDTRNLKNDAEQLHNIAQQLSQVNISLSIIYLDADDNKLIARFNETRRKHPLTDPHTSLQDALSKEHELLFPFAQHAKLRIDTSQLSIYQLRNILLERLNNTSVSLTLIFQSFGFKHGVPHNSDYIFDIRCLPNPYWQTSLRRYTGIEQPIINYLQQYKKVQKMQQDISQFLDNWIPEILTTSRHYLTISIGCTGGQHRSVYLVEQLGKHFIKQKKYHVQIQHRELS